MGKVWFDEFANIALNFEQLNILYPKIINANFTRKHVTAGAAATGNQPAIDPTVELRGITEGIFGRTVYIIVETENMQGDEVTIELIRYDDGSNDVLSVTDGTADVASFTATVGDTTALEDNDGNNPYSNLVDFEDQAIFKIDFRPHARADFDTWAQQIHAATAPEIKVRVRPAANGAYVEYGTTGNSTSNTHPDGHVFGQYEIENKNVYEIYHADNLFNTLGNHNHNGQVVRRRIARIENDSSTDVVYFFYNIIDNYHEICECPITTARRRNNGQRISTTLFQSTYSNFTSSVPAPAGGDAQTNYHYADGAIISYGQAYGYRRYALTSPNNPNDLVDLVRMPNNLNIDEELGENRVRATFSYRNTARRFCNPDCFAGFIGTLIQLGRADVVCTGMCFGDATSYPSVTHPNGDSVDTAYLANLAREQLKVNAFNDLYFQNILKGRGYKNVQRVVNGVSTTVRVVTIAWLPNLNNATAVGGHEDHLHSGDFITNRVSTLNQ